MRFYPELPGRRFATVGHDVLLVVVLVLLAWLGLKVHDAVDQLAVLGSGVKQVGDAVPVVGGPVSDLGQEARTPCTTSPTCSAWSRSDCRRCSCSGGCCPSGLRRLAG